MKKRIFILALIAMLISTGFVWAAGNEEGEDAHSPSMSAESGEEPIEDLSTTKDPGAVDTEDGAEAESGEQVDAAEEDQEAEADADAEEPEEEEFTVNVPWKKAAIAGGIVLVVLIFIVSLISRSRKKKKEYIGKHGKK